MNKEVIKKLIKTRNIIRRKLKSLKRGNIVLEEQFLPITRPLNIIVSKLQKNDDKQIKQEFKSEFKEEQINPEVSVNQSLSLKRPSPKKSREPSFIEAEIITQDDGDITDDDDGDRSIRDSFNGDITDDDDGDRSIRDSFNTSRVEMRTMLDDPSAAEYLNQFHELSRKYVEGMIRDTEDKYDFKYGVRLDPVLSKFYVGNSIITIKDDADLVIGNVTYKGSPGLYELLFKKKPRNYTIHDENEYHDIILQTNAHRRNYDPQAQISGNKYWKYKHVILPILQERTRLASWGSNSKKKKSGRGMLMEVTDNTIDYVHWDDPNELVDRLRLLLGSQEAGHTGHTNEINSIIKELREAQIIK
jgi:hypothetical protein